MTTQADIDREAVANVLLRLDFKNEKLLDALKSIVKNTTCEQTRKIARIVVDTYSEGKND